MPDSIIAALILAVLVLGGFWGFRRTGGPGALFAGALAAGYFSAFPAGWLNGWAGVLIPLLPWGLLASALVEEGLRVGLFGFFFRRLPSLAPESFFWLAGGLWTGFAVFEAVLVHLTDGPVPVFSWLPILLHGFLGLFWGGSMRAFRRYSPMIFLLSVLLHGGFNLMMSYGQVTGALVLTGGLGLWAFIGPGSGLRGKPGLGRRPR